MLITWMVFMPDGFYREFIAPWQSRDDGQAMVIKTGAARMQLTRFPCGMNAFAVVVFVVYCRFSVGGDISPALLFIHSTSHTRLARPI